MVLLELLPYYVSISIYNFVHCTKILTDNEFEILILDTVHEIPHEVGDFAILLRSGFSRWDAAKAQLLTAGAGLVGALVAIGGTNVTSAMEARTSWIMPFTAGGFLHISLVTVLPDLLKENDSKESIKQLTALIAGIAVMAFMTIVFES